MRMIQTNLREIDADLDPDVYVRSLKDFSAEVVLFNVGGIVANYPTDLPFHFRNPNLKDDLVGKVLGRVKAEGMRFLARFDFSKVNEEIARRHPDWLYRGVKGEEVNYNGQVQACVNGEYQQECSLAILGEVIDRYPLDGVFFNMIGYQTHDYSGNYHGICQCDNCRRRFRDSFGADLPRREDVADPVFRRYEEFRRRTSRDLFWRITDFIKKRRGDLAVCTGTHEGVDIYRKESNTGYDRPLPEWTYSASDNVKSVRGSWEHMVAANTAVHFIDFPFRHSAVSPHLTAARLAGDLISGGWIDYYVIGTLEGQDDRLCFEGARDVFRFHASADRWFAGTRPEADVCLVVPAASERYGSGAEYRGLYRILSEEHVLFDATEDGELEDPGARDKLARYRAVLLPDARCLGEGAIANLDAYVEAGGRLLMTGATSMLDARGEPRETPGLRCAGVRRVAARHPRASGTYFRVGAEDKAALAGFPDLDILYLDSELLECETEPGIRGLLRYVPPVMFGPPEKCYYTRVTSVPGVLVAGRGAGRCAFLPWRVGTQYVKLSHWGHRHLVARVLREPLGLEPRLVTDASPLVEVAVHREAGGRWRWVGLLNHSGQLGTAFHQPLPVRGIEVRLNTGRKPKAVTALRAGRKLRFRFSRDGWVSFTVPELKLFEVVVLR